MKKNNSIKQLKFNFEDKPSKKIKKEGKVLNINSYDSIRRKKITTQIIKYGKSF